MVAKEIYPEPVEEHTDLQDLEEARLSLCDLPLYNDAAEWDDFSKEDKSSLEDQDFFEFFSEDFTASTCPAQNIIFCGKLIPYKEPVFEETQKLQNNTEQYPKKRGLFQWKSKSFNKSKTSPSGGVKGQCKNNSRNNYSKLQQFSSSKSMVLPTSEKYGFTAGKCVDKYDISVPKVSILTAPTKSRRHLFMFGLLRLPVEMELSDIRSRQHRRTPSSTLFQSFDGRDEVTVGKSRGKGFWRLPRALGCRTHHAIDVVPRA